ncbi:hypothetical protein ACIQGZ_17355 [Streptomyces sp. NPDC092296]|uniref:hypothetical protein n=1 Tax=Streptomyces sp. NPDC092296 TaxID=3366012 RepID=UPI00380BB02B
MAVFYRLHWSDCPPLTPDNAWSAPWRAGDTRRSPDGSGAWCLSCDGTGKDWRPCPRCDEDPDHTPTCEHCDGQGAIDECATCDGTGWEPCVHGYSCTENPEDLLAYFAERHMTSMLTGEPVVVFEGQQVDTGCDGEPTAIPTRVIETLTWSEFTARHAA